MLFQWFSVLQFQRAKKVSKKTTIASSFLYINKWQKFEICFFVIQWKTQFNLTAFEIEDKEDEWSVDTNDDEDFNEDISEIKTRSQYVSIILPMARKSHQIQEWITITSSEAAFCKINKDNKNHFGLKCMFLTFKNCKIIIHGIQQQQQQHFICTVQKNWSLQCLQ